MVAVHGEWRDADRRRATWWAPLAIFAAGYGAVLSFVLFEPSNHVPSSSIAWISRHLTARGLPPQISAGPYVDFWCNALIMMPLAAALVWLWPRLSWERLTAFAFAASASVEITQSLFLPHRVPAFSDVVANTAGVLVGGLVAALLRGAMRRVSLRRRRPTTPASG